MSLPLPMHVDVHNSAQNAFVQEWLKKWSNTFVTKENIAKFYDLPVDHSAVETLWRNEMAEDHIEDVVEDLQGTYNYRDHDRERHTFSARFPNIHNAVIHTQDDPNEGGFGGLRVSGTDNTGRRVWIEIHPKCSKP